MFSSHSETAGSPSITKYQLKKAGRSLSYRQTIDLWSCDQDFREFFNHTLANSPYSAFRWETPVLTNDTVDSPFEFVLLDTPGFATRPTDSHSFKNFFTDDDADQGVVCFQNLSGDATLVVPSPRTDLSAYGHLAAFIRNAPRPQVDALWQVVGRTVKEKISDKPFWLSTAGGGVAWLHVRLDNRPKYYGYGPYKR